MQFLVFVKGLIEIQNATALQKATSDIVLSNSISLSSNFDQIPYFSGIFDGNGYIISDLISSKPFIKQCVNCYIKNVSFVHFIIRTDISALIYQSQNLTLDSVALNHSVFIGTTSASSIVYFAISDLSLQNVTVFNVKLSAQLESGLFSVSTFRTVINNSFVQVMSTNGTGICNSTISLEVYNSEIRSEVSNVVIQINALVNVVDEYVIVNNSAFEIVCNYCETIVVMDNAAALRTAHFSYFNITSLVSVIVNNYLAFANSFMYFTNQIKKVNLVAPISSSSCSYIFTQENIAKPTCESQTCDIYTTYAQLKANLLNCKLSLNDLTLHFETKFAAQDFCPSFGCDCDPLFTGSRCSQCKYYTSSTGCTNVVPDSNGDCAIINEKIICSKCDPKYVLNEEKTECVPDKSQAVCNNGSAEIESGKIVCICYSGYDPDSVCLQCLYGFEFVGDKCYQILNTEHGDCFQGEGRIVCTKCDSGYKLVKQVCKEDVDIIYIILGVICGLVILISAIVAVIVSCQLKQYRKPQFLAFQPQVLASDAAWQGKVVKAEKFGDLMRM
ncbi:Transmembrane_domain-containing protein [Hexamita inflata]|uniref:Transmembrane domain-containing protein n=1 Tax=Hexamita inflata TaxID=28002 RepID=A0AA86QJR3_9EUKA|nr:Transmembrane domain-containing protein [Hexamita inflata]